jgi:HPt (histidine-containing phosphotransfer) domain-containing protein
LEPPSAATPPPAEPALAGGDGAFNRAEVLDRCLGDESLMATLLQVFVQQADEDLAEIQRATAAGDVQKVLKATHRLKGSAANLALERVRQAALAMETHVREQGLAGAESLVDTLRTDVAALEAAVR